MGEKTTIEWCTATWNPWIGCSKVSPGCDSCYMFAGMRRYGRDPEIVQRTKDQTFFAPLKWKLPQHIFTCSWSDFFHKQADPWREEAWDVILRTPQHVYQILTKRPGLMVAWAEKHGWPDHVWAGTSVESQKYVPRLNVLARVPAKVRFVSMEPMLGPVDLRKWIELGLGWYGENANGGLEPDRACNWVIAGGESGPGARPAHPDWFRQVRDQCQAAGVPFFFKQWGTYASVPKMPSGIGQLVRAGDVIVAQSGKTWLIRPDLSCEGEGQGAAMRPLGKKAAGALLDGREWREMPA